MILCLSNDIYGLKEQHDVAVFLARCQIRHSVSRKCNLYKLSLIKSKLSGLYLPPNFLLKFIWLGCLQEAYLFWIFCEVR